VILLGNRLETFGPYVLLRKVASGGMAEIYKAKLGGAGGFEKIVAIKRIRPEYSRNAEFVQMLIDEAKIAVRLTHANIAQVINLERVGSDWGLVLEYVDGVDLFRMERALEQHERRLGVDECVHIAKEVLSGLDFVHRLTDDEGAPLGMIHCDISPGNVMMNLGGEVKLIDFGVARASGVPISGLPGGKIRYRAPEQVRNEELDPRSDIYSVGVVLWELLAGERIYESLTLEEILERVQRGDVPPVESARPGLPDGLVRVLRRALYPDPLYRYPHAAAFIRALEDLEIGRDPARSRRVLAEIVRAVTIPRRMAERRSKKAVVRVADDPSLEDVLEEQLDYDPLEEPDELDFET
jgi:eukaryotic-like serine/threonine-protein kinase